MMYQKRVGLVSVILGVAVWHSTVFAEQKLPDLVEAYFRSSDPVTRSTLLDEIELRKDATILAVRDILAHVSLWDAKPSGFSSFRFQTERGDATSVHVHVPRGYDPAKAYPLLIALHGQGGRGEGYIRFALSLLGDRMHDYIVAAPTQYKGWWVGSTLKESEDPMAIIRKLKRMYHIDSDRVYVNGYSMGGHSSFLAAVLHTDQFAGVVPLAGSLMTQLGWEAAELMLPNVRSLPMLVVWGNGDVHDRFGNVDKVGKGIHGANLHVRGVSKRFDLGLDMVELDGVGHSGVKPPPERFSEILRRVRPHVVKKFDHWFRYPSQGRMCWLRLAEYQGIPWKGRRFVVRLKPGEVYSEGALRTMKLRLAYVGGEIDGQTIRVETRKCKSIDVVLHDGLVDLDRDVVVEWKGEKVFGGRVTPSVRTMLELAYEDWDFQRLFPVRLHIRRGGRVTER